MDGQIRSFPASNLPVLVCLDKLQVCPLDRTDHRFWGLWYGYLHRHPRHPQLRRRQLPNLFGFCPGRRDTRKERCGGRVSSLRNPNVRATGSRVGEFVVGILEHHHDPDSLDLVRLWRETAAEKPIRKVRCSHTSLQVL